MPSARREALRRVRERVSLTAVPRSSISQTFLPRRCPLETPSSRKDAGRPIFDAPSPGAAGWGVERSETTLLPYPKHVISTEAADRLIVRCEVERPLYFARAKKSSCEWNKSAEAQFQHA